MGVCVTQEDDQLRANRKVRALRSPRHEGASQHDEAMETDAAQLAAQSTSTLSVSPSSHMAGLHLREMPL